MKRFLAFVPLAAALTACGPRAPGPHGGELIYWRVTGSDLAFSNCTDDPSFRDNIKPVEFNENTYLIYLTDPDGQHSTSQTCETFEKRSCTPSASGVVFETAGHQLLFTKESKSDLGTQGCKLQSVQQWTLTDKGEDLEVEITNTLSEVDNPTACESAENSIKAQSPNKLGLSGCVVTFNLTATIKSR